MSSFRNSERHSSSRLDWIPFIYAGPSLQLSKDNTVLVPPNKPTKPHKSTLLSTRLDSDVEFPCVCAAHVCTNFDCTCVPGVIGMLVVMIAFASLLRKS